MEFECILRAWQKHEAALYGYLINELRDTYQAEDVLQDTFIKAIQLGKSFCSINNPRAWLFQVARNTLIDKVRLSKPQEELSEDLVNPIEEPQPIDSLDGCLSRNLNEMNLEDREIIEQCDLQGVKQQKFADMHNLGLPAVKSRLQRARKRLREAIILNCKVSFDDSGQVCCHIPRPLST